MHAGLCLQTHGCIHREWGGAIWNLGTRPGSVCTLTPHNPQETQNRAGLPVTWVLLAGGHPFTSIPHSSMLRIFTECHRSQTLGRPRGKVAALGDTGWAAGLCWGVSAVSGVFVG